MTDIRTTLAQEVLESITPLIGESELWCHRTRITDPTVFWAGLRIPAIQAGLRSTATRLTDKDEFPSFEAAIEEFTDRCIEEEPMNNARVFVIAPEENRHLLIPLESRAPFQHKGLLPGEFVLAHLCLLDGRFSTNPLRN